jgi:peptidoglycan hydrolase-like protein with peptidoglycan-binding domain
VRGVRLLVGATAVALIAVVGAAPAAAEETPSPAPTAEPTADPDPSPPADVPADPEPEREPATQDRLSLPMHKGDSGRYVHRLHKRLAWMGYSVRAREVRHEHFGVSTKKAARSFQTKFFLDPSGIVNKRTWKQLKGISTPLDRLPRACRTQTSLCIDKTQKLLRYVRNDKVVLTVDARFGAYGTPTREGVFSVFSKSRDHYSSLYGSWMPFAMFFSGGQAVHYSPYFARDGYYGASHGCINIRDYDSVRWLFDRVPLGTRVVVYRS